MTAKKPEKSESAAFEKSMKRLEEIVEQLEGGDVALDKSFQLYEEGKKLGKQCEKQLTEIEKKVMKIVDKGDDVEMEPFGASEDSESDSDVE